MTLLFFILSIILVYIAFLTFLGLTSPQSFIQLLKLLKRYRFRVYAKRYGRKAAYEDLDGQTWILNPWEQTLLKNSPRPSEAQHYAFMWSQYLRIACSLTHSRTSPETKVTLSQRWQAFKNSLLGLGIELGLVKLK